MGEECQMSEQKRSRSDTNPATSSSHSIQRKQRWSVLVCHRRAGKTVATLNDLIRERSTRVSMRGATPSSSRSAIRPRTRHGATCAAMPNRFWPSHPMNLNCGSISSMDR